MHIFRSPAKVNLFLQILDRRQDGYHEIASLFQTISLFDTLYMSLSNVDLLTCTDKSLPTDHTNLISKAIKLFRNKTGIKNSFVVHLEKSIPQQGGLGGGSSNAATTLWGLNQICGQVATLQDLIKWGAEVGSDVPFFLSSGTAFCTGRGEIIRTLPPLKNLNAWVIKPSEGLSTPEVYRRVTPSELAIRNPKEILAGFFNGNPVYFNDLEKPAFEILPELAILKKNLLNSGFSVALMSGSGSSFFCLGKGIVPSFAGIKSYSVEFINRDSESWFS